MNENLKTALIASCVSNAPEMFLPFLMSTAVQTAAPDKMDFYIFFKDMIAEAHLRAKGSLFLNMEARKATTDKGILSYNFYDGAHIHPLLSLEVKEKENQIHLDIMPF